MFTNTIVHHVRAYLLMLSQSLPPESARASTYGHTEWSMSGLIHIVFPKADAVVSSEWMRECYEIDEASEAALWDARFHKAPSVRES